MLPLLEFDLPNFVEVEDVDAPTMPPLATMCSVGPILLPLTPLEVEGMGGVRRFRGSPTTR